MHMHIQVAGEDKISGYGDSTVVQKTAGIDLKVTNANNFGCAGKSPTAIALFRSEAQTEGAGGGARPSLVPVPETEASIRIASVPSHSKARAESHFTSYDGIIQINVYFAFISPNASASSFYLRFDFDGGAISSPIIGPLAKEEPADHSKTATFISSLTTVSPPPRQLVVKQPFNMSLQLRNPEGSTAEIARLATPIPNGLRMMICQVTFIVHIFVRCLRSVFSRHLVCTAHVNCSHTVTILPP